MRNLKTYVSGLAMKKCGTYFPNDTKCSRSRLAATPAMISSDGCAAASRDLAVVTEPLREQKGL
ncbi:MAG: hypothetical protein IID44_18725 [Planctomycetes bacterium]|nr:hypothetical protein [Planctomycetota bacterium]